MTKFRKLCSVVFFLAALFGVGTLASDWFGIEPFATTVRYYKGEGWFEIMLMMLLCLVAVGAIVILLRAVLQRGRKTFQRVSNELGGVQISKAAIVQAAEAPVLDHAELRYLKTNVRIVNSRNPYVDITTRVAPRGAISVAEVAPVLQQQIKESVEAMTGNRVRSVVVDVRENRDLDDRREGPDSDDAQAEAEVHGAAGETPEDGTAEKAALAAHTE